MHRVTAACQAQSAQRQCSPQTVCQGRDFARCAQHCGLGLKRLLRRCWLYTGMSPAAFRLFQAYFSLRDSFFLSAGLYHPKLMAVAHFQSVAGQSLLLKPPCRYVTEGQFRASHRAELERPDANDARSAATLPGEGIRSQGIAVVPCQYGKMLAAHLIYLLSQHRESAPQACRSIRSSAPTPSP